MSNPVDRRLLSASELDHYDALQRAGKDFRALARLGVKMPHSAAPRTYLALTAWALCTAGAFWLVVQADRQPEPTSDGIFLVLLFIAMVPGFMAVFCVLYRETSAWHATVLPKYLHSIGYAERVDAQAATAANARRSSSTESGRTYPVTDGGYDPELYAQRGGRASYREMRALGISDYSTYVNNVVEAD